MIADKPKRKRRKSADPAAAEVLDGAAVESDAADPAEAEEPGPGDPIDLEPAPDELAEVELSEDLLPPVETDKPELPTRSLVRADPLSLYVSQIRRYPLITREEEHELAVRFAKDGDVEAARRLVTSNLRLVIKIAYEYQRAHRNLLDLIQEGNIGLIQAVKKYDPYRGVKLSSYAAWWIRAYMIKYILNNWRLVKIGTTQAQRKLFFNLRKEKEKLEKLGFEPSPKLLAQNLDVSEEEVVDMDRRLAQGELSLDAPVGRDDEGGRSHMDMLESAGDARPDVAAEGTEFRALLKQKLAAFDETLRGREQTIFRERLLNDAPSTLQEIGEKYGISRERARQLEKRLLAKLKVYLRQELGDAVQIAMGLED